MCKRESCSYSAPDQDDSSLDVERAKQMSLLESKDAAVDELEQARILSLLEYENKVRCGAVRAWRCAVVFVFVRARGWPSAVSGGLWWAVSCELWVVSCGW